MITRRSLAVAGFALGIAASCANAQEKVRFATEGAFAPYNYTEPNGTLAGFEIDLYKDLCTRAKLECTIEAQAFDGIIPALNAGKFDAIIAGMSITPKREEAVMFTIPYANVGQIFMTMKSGTIGELGETGTIYSLTTNEAGAKEAIEKLKPKLKGKVIGVQTSTIAAAFMKQYLDGIVEVRDYKTTEQNDKAHNCNEQLQPPNDLWLDFNFNLQVYIFHHLVRLTVCVTRVCRICHIPLLYIHHCSWCEIRVLHREGKRQPVRFVRRLLQANLV